eukprot:647824-Pyramimonas_sp.AAC.1
MGVAVVKGRTCSQALKCAWTIICSSAQWPSGADWPVGARWRETAAIEPCSCRTVLPRVVTVLPIVWNSHG